MCARQSPRDCRARRAAVSVLQHDLPDVADQADVDLDVLVDLGAVDLDVDLLRVERVGLDVAGHAVVEAHAERDEQVGFLDRGVDPGLAVHAHHAEVERMRRRHAADAEQRHRDRDVGVLGELPHQVAGAGVDDAVAGQDQRPLGGVDQLDRARRGRPRRGAGRAASRAARAASGHSNSHDCCWQSLVRSISTGPGRPERATWNASRTVAATSSGLRHQVVVLGDRQRDAGDVGFLEGVRADELAAHLAGDADDRRAVHHRRGDAGDQVGRAGAGGGDRHADLAGGAGVAVGHVRRALLVPHQHVADGVVEHRVVGGQDGPARIAEDAGHAFADERLPQNLRTSSSLDLPWCEEASRSGYP